MDIRRQLSTVAALMFVACLVQAWMIWRAVVPAQDCVRYLVVAQSFARDGATATLRSQGEQPLFPALVWLAHGILSAVRWIDTANWAVALQVAAAIPLVLSVAPVYLLFQRLHGDRAALAATVLYCLLGGVSRLGADGLSDSTHLALFMVALWCVARYFSAPEFGSPGWLLASGLSTGLALTARCESLVLPVALLATFGWLVCSGPKRPTRRQTAIGAASLALGLALVLLPYLAWCDALPPRAALARLMGRAGAGEAAPLNDFHAGSRADVTEPRWELPGMGRLVFGKKDTSTSSRFHGYLSAAAKLLHELAQTLHYWLGALALVGLAARWRQLATPLDRFMQCLCAMLIAAGIMVAARAGYLSTRHVLLLVVLALGWAGYGSLVLADWLSTRGRWSNVEWRRKLASVAIALTVIVACGADCRAALHASREAHRQAARWLSTHASPTAAVLDSRGWTALYTGRKTYRYEAAQAAFTDSALRYVVVEQAELAAGSRRSETMRLLMNHAGEPVARFMAEGSDKHSVVVYRWQPEHFQQLGVQSYAR